MISVNWEAIILASFWVVGIQNYIQKGFEKALPKLKIPTIVWWVLSAVLAFGFSIIVTMQPEKGILAIIANTLSILSVSQVGYATLFKGVTGLVTAKIEAAKKPDSNVGG